MQRPLGFSAVALAGVLMSMPVVGVTQPAEVASRPAAPSGEHAALIDLTGEWVSIVDEDWRFRMMTPPKGDYLEVPLNAAARRLADGFDPMLYGGVRYQVSQIIDCRAYGAAGLMHMPMRLQIGWESPNELRMQSDWGGQTRVLHFVPGQPYETVQSTPRPSDASDAGGAARRVATTQGYSVAEWEQPYQNGALAYQRGPMSRPFSLYRSHITDPQPGGTLAVITTDLKPGWLRRNGVPYGSQTRLIEHYMAFHDPTGRKWFDVTTEVIDPEYLTAPFLTTSDFQQEPDGSRWAPHPCKQVAG